MKLHCTLIAMYAALALMGFASASSLFYGDGADDANQNIVGGIEATSGRYNYTVALAYTSNSFQFCGGSLIAPDVVLTAAHCVGGKSFKAVIGRHNLKTSSGEEIVRQTDIVHPNYNRTSMMNDFAIVILSRATALDIQFVKLNYDAAYPADGATSRTMGWGRTTQGGTGSNVLREVDLPIITNELCNQTYPGEIYTSMICTFQPGKDSCQGDSGGPLIIPGSSADQDTLIGVVSWGIGCATNQYPGVYARVSDGYDWINTTVCSQSAFPPSKLCGSSATSFPTINNQPTTDSPTNMPTTESPTNMPTTESPTNKPTTESPTSKPTAKSPTNKPTAKPRTNKPTAKPPTNKPTAKPPTNKPTPAPTPKPTFTPTNIPSMSSSTSLSPAISSCRPNVRKVKLVSTTGQQIQTFEVQVYSISGSNIAKGKIATQSSTLRSFLASKAVDNKFDTFSHTSDSNAWLQIDLGGVYDIDSIVIANRWCIDISDPNDCLCRLSDANLILIDGKDSVIATASIGNACGSPNISHAFGSSPSFCPTHSGVSPTYFPTYF